MAPIPAGRAALVVAAMTCIASAQDLPGLPNEPHIVVTGSGSAQAEPDYLELSLEVTMRRPDGPAAKASVDEIATAVLRALHDLGIAREQLDVSPVTLDVEYDYEENTPVVRSYKASRSIDLTLLEIGRFDEVVAKVIEAGATGVSSPRLRSKKEVELSDQAQALAIQDARITANSLARGFGRELGPVYAITTSEARAWRRGRGGGIFGDPGDEWLTFHPSPIEISQSVYAVFLLGPRTMPAKD